MGLMRTIVNKGASCEGGDGGLGGRLGTRVGAVCGVRLQAGRGSGNEEGSGGSSSQQGHASRDATKATSKTRTYYIAADEVDWDYAPSGKNQITGEPFGGEEDIFVR
jgi:hypothetical protein